MFILKIARICGVVPRIFLRTKERQREREIERKKDIVGSLREMSGGRIAVTRTWGWEVVNWEALDVGESWGRGCCCCVVVMWG
jgi:hypothetical protein